MTNRERVEYLTDEDIIIFDNPSYEGALIGITWEGQAIYDYNRMIKSLMKEGMTEEEAADFICYNYSYNPKGNYPTIANTIIDWWEDI